MSLSFDMQGAQTAFRSVLPLIFKWKINYIIKLREINLRVLTVKCDERSEIIALELFTEMYEKRCWWLIKIVLISAKSQVLNFPYTFQV